MAKTTLNPQAEAKAADADSPEVKIDVRAESRQNEHVPQTMFAIEINGETHKQQAKDSREAWALFCDARKSWPSPKSAKITEVK